MAADPATTALVITAIGSALSGIILAVAKLVEMIAYLRGDDDDELGRRRHKRRRHRPPEDDGTDEGNALLQARLA
jgi:hypothetical protein